MVRLAPLVLACACLSAACADSHGSAAPAVRDSSGVAIVENARPAWDAGEGWRLSDVPVLSLGVADGATELEFDRVTDVLRLSDGRLVVANDGSGELRYFAADGRFLGVAGRTGEGPGEFRSIARLWPAGGDTVVAYDPLLNRVSTFVGTGTFIGATTLAPVAGGGPLPLEVVGRFGDGSLLVRGLPRLPLDARPGMKRDSVSYFLTRPGESALPVGRFPGDESYVVREGSGVSANQPLFGRRTHVVVAGNRFYLGTADAHRIDARAADGRLLRSVRAGQPAARVSGAHAERYRREYLARAGPESRPRLERILAGLPVPAAFPAHGRMLVDTEGSLWVAAYPRPGEERTVWNVFDAHGRWLGPVGMPARLRVTAVGGGVVVGVRRGNDEVERVEVYRLVR